MMDRPPITHVAILFREKVYSLPPPNRHHQVMMKILDEEKDREVTYANIYAECEPGFLDASGRFLRRAPALVSALANNQVLDESKIKLNKLFSEDVW